MSFCSMPRLSEDMYLPLCMTVTSQCLQNNLYIISGVTSENFEGYFFEVLILGGKVVQQTMTNCIYSTFFKHLQDDTKAVQVCLPAEVQGIKREPPLWGDCQAGHQQNRLSPEQHTQSWFAFVFPSHELYRSGRHSEWSSTHALVAFSDAECERTVDSIQPLTGFEGCANCWNY